MPTEAGTSERDQQFMQAALELAERGRFTTMPNPRVGCVIALHDTVVGRGAHMHAGQQHAEVIALVEAGASARGATAYVTLEPCSYHGRTGPCTDALIAAGVARVVYALDDPNPKVAGQGSAALLGAGIVVKAGLQAEAARVLNRGFFKRMQTATPFVQAKMAMSLDGRTAMADGDSQWITGPAARQQVQRLRAQSCAIITGIGTVLSDDPALTVRADELGEDQINETCRQPALVVVDSQLRTPLSAKIVREAAALGRRVLIACAGAADAERREALAAQGIEVREFASEASAAQVDLRALLAYLAGCEYNEVMLEAGAHLLGGFIAQHLLDELNVFVAPKMLGAAARPLAEIGIASMRDAENFKLCEVRQIGEDCLLRYSPAHDSPTHDSPVHNHTA